MRMPQFKGWKNVAALFVVPILLGLTSAYNQHALNNWQMVWAAIEAAFFGGIVQQLVGWFLQESPTAPHVVDKVEPPPVPPSTPVEMPKAA